MALNLIKRGGAVQEFSIFKLQKLLTDVCRGFPLDSQKPLLNLDEYIKDGMTTADLFNALTMNVLSLTSVEEPEWKNVAGRLKMLALYKQVSLARNMPKNEPPYDYVSFLKYAVNNGIYSTVIAEKYTTEEIAEAASFINPDFDFVYDYAGANLLLKRYLCEYGDKIVELPQDMFLSIALLIERDEDKAARMAKVKDTYEKLADRKISLGTPLLMNLRRPNGNLSSASSPQWKTRASRFFMS